MQMRVHSSAQVAPAPPPRADDDATRNGSARDGKAHTPSCEAEKQPRDDDDKLPPFRPLPTMLVFPNLPLLAFWCFTMGLTKKSTSLLAFSRKRGGIACGVRCKLVAALTLVLVGCVVLLGLTMLLRFSRRHRKARSSTPPEAAGECTRAHASL